MVAEAELSVEGPGAVNLRGRFRVESDERGLTVEVDIDEAGREPVSRRWRRSRGVE